MEYFLKTWYADYSLKTWSHRRRVFAVDLPSLLGLVIGTCLAFSSGLALFTQPAQAQVQYATESANVSATIPATEDNSEPPSNIILISPENNAIVNISRPTFIWREATDATGIKKYTFSLDGQIWFDDIPTTPTENDDYVLKYDNTTGYYSLTPKSNITDGTHTWKVRAENNNGVGTDSATWNFTIDTLAPSFVVTNVGEVETSISAQDPSTVPEEPIELNLNEPLIIAVGEANATVTMTVTIPGDPNQVFTSDISATGTWGQQLGLLPRNIVMYLDFVIIDQAGHVSTLNDVPFIILGTIITMPPDPVGEPILELSIIPGAEIIQEIIQESGEQIDKSFGSVLTPIADFTTATMSGLRGLGSIGLGQTIPFLPLLLTIVVPVVSTIGTTGSLSIKLVTRTLQSLGLLPAGNPQGIVFDSVSHRPVSFALLTIVNSDRNSEDIIQETVVTDVNGVYRGIKLQPDSYILEAKHQEYLFPTRKNRPPYLTIKDFYKGEPFAVKSKKSEQLFLIPLDHIDKPESQSWKNRFKLAILRFNSKVNALIYPLFFFSFIILVYYPTIWNWIVFSMYGSLVLVKVLEWFKVPNFTGSVIDDQGNAIVNTVIRLSNPDTNELTALVTTDEDGFFEAFVDKQLFQLYVMKPGFIWARDDALGMYQVDLTSSSVQLVITMKPASSLISDLV